VRTTATGDPVRVNHVVRVYVVREVLEFCVVVAGIAVVAQFTEVPLWAWTGIPAAKAMGSIAFYFLFLRKSFVGTPQHAPATLIGRRGHTLSWLEAQGTVRIRGEMWSARSHDGRAIPPDRDVLVTGIQGITLLVRSAGDDS
jgi:membrane protein implicated in regulation of membrane protease activity